MGASTLRKSTLSGIGKTIGSGMNHRMMFAHNKEDEVLERGYESVSSDDEDGQGLEYAFPDDGLQDDEPSSGGRAMVSADLFKAWV